MRLWLPVLGQNFASCAAKKVNSRLQSSSSDLGGHGSKCHPPCIGVARIFDWGGGAKQKSHAMKSLEIFERGIFVGQTYRIEWKIRSRGLVWHLTESFLKVEGLNQKLQMKI